APAPDSGHLQAMFWSSDQRRGSPFSVLTPSPAGPRHWGQLPARSGGAAITVRNRAASEKLVRQRSITGLSNSGQRELGPSDYVVAPSPCPASAAPHPCPCPCPCPKGQGQGHGQGHGARLHGRS